jgi:lipoprotein NlpD
MKISWSNKVIFFLIFLKVLGNLYCMSSRPLYVTPSDKYHIVKQGDTLSAISRKYGISAEELMLYNNLTDDRIRVGEKIYLQPRLLSKWTYITRREIPEDGRHIVGVGETLPLIAKMYGLDLLDLIHYNTISNWVLESGSIIYLSHSSAGKKEAVQKVTRPKDIPDKPEIKVEKKTELESEKRQLLPPDALDHQPVDVYKITKHFDKEARHQGIDLAAPAGTPIYAVFSGRVVYAGVQKGYGNLVILEHSDRIMTVYAHNENNLVVTGEQVKAGDQIATMGSTGRSTGNHLHFEIRKAGKPLDPAPYLKNKGR